MPRGALPTPRHVLAAAEPFLPPSGTRTPVPSGNFPSPPQELAAARPFKTTELAIPTAVLACPSQIAAWPHKTLQDSIWAEEAFAKICADPNVLISPELLAQTALTCGRSNFAAFLQSHGFVLNGQAYLNGEYLSLDWTDAALLNGAIAQLGPVKIVISDVDRENGTDNLPISQQDTENASRAGTCICASLFGFGPLAFLIRAFNDQGIETVAPGGNPNDPGYALFISGGFEVIEHSSIIDRTIEAWVRNPTTIIGTVDQKVFP